MHTIRIAASEGLYLTADQWGDPKNSPVMMFHGAGQNRHAWKKTASSLSEQGYFVITVDARGHGDSDWSPDAHYESDDVGRDIQALISNLSRRPAVVGASMGGMGCLAAQRLHGQQLFEAVVLVDITPDFDAEGARRVISFMAGHPDGFRTLDEAAAAIAAYNPHRKKAANSAGLSKVLQQREDGRWIWRWDPAYVSSKPGFDTNSPELMSATMARTSKIMAEGLRSVEAPVLLVRGQQSDLVTPEAVKKFLDIKPEAEFVDVAGTGHMVAGDDNDAFTSAVAKFLLKHFSPTFNQESH